MRETGGGTAQGRPVVLTDRPCLVGLLRTYCNRNDTTRQIDGLVAEARSQTGVAPPRRAPHPPRSARTGKKLPDETEWAIVAEYKAGQTMKQIAARHHIHRVTVSEVLDRTGTTKRPKGMSPSQVDIAVRLYESGLSLPDFGHFVSLGSRPGR